MRRSRIIAGVLALVLAGSARGEDALTVATWGGAYEEAQARALFKPFEAATGTTVRIATHRGGLDPLREQAGAQGWQVIDMLEADAIAACDAGLLRRLDHGAIFGERLAVLEADLAPFRLRPCSLPQNVFATVMAYDDRAFPGAKPTRIADFFDLDRFPGKRAVEKRPGVILEWALMAEGVPPEQVYDLLSTDRGLDLAFRRLDTIRDAIVWWERAEEPARLLAEGKAAMASGYNGRFFAAAAEGAPLVILWDGRVIGLDVWAVPREADGLDIVRHFLRFATRRGPMAALASLIPYGPSRASAFARIGLHADLGIPMRDQLPNAPRPDRRVLHEDSRWLARTKGLRERRFREWLSRDGAR